MTQGVGTRLDSEILVVRIPMRIQRRGGRKRIVAPDGSELAPTIRPQPDGTLVKALARAWRRQKLLDEGVYASVSDIAEAERINRSYVSRVLRLTLLAPDIIERIVDGRNLPGLSELLTPFPIEWLQQRSVLLCAHPAKLTQRPLTDQILLKNSRVAVVLVC